MIVEYRMNLRLLPLAFLLGLLSACASMPPPQVQRAERLPNTATAGSPGVLQERLPEAIGGDGPRAVIRRGSGAPKNSRRWTRAMFELPVHWKNRKPRSGWWLGAFCMLGQCR